MVIFLSAFLAVCIVVVGYQVCCLYQYQNKAGRSEELYNSPLAAGEPGVC